MSTDHPVQEDLKRFMRDELARADAAGIVRHLLTGCPRCVSRTRQIWNLGERPRALKVLLEEMRDLESSARRWPGHSRASLY